MPLQYYSIPTGEAKGRGTNRFKTRVRSCNETSSLILISSGSVTFGLDWDKFQEVLAGEEGVFFG